jgi:hypothetical protein
MQMSDAAYVIPIYIILFVLAYLALGWMVRKVIDPEGDLLFGVPMPGPIRWVIIVISLVAPWVMFLAAIRMAQVLL